MAKDYDAWNRKLEVTKSKLHSLTLFYFCTIFYVNKFYYPVTIKTGLVAFTVKVLRLLQPQVISVHQHDFIKGRQPNIGFLDWILITYLATLLDFYHCSATKEVL